MSCTVSSPSLMGGEGGGEKRRLVQLDPKEKMSYTVQAAKRQHCQRLTRYKHVCKYTGIHLCAVVRDPNVWLDSPCQTYTYINLCTSCIVFPLYN